MSIIPTRSVIGRAVLGVVLDLPICGVVVYGSIAAGTATTASDLDTFVLTGHDLSDLLCEQIRADFIALQQRLGLQPDQQHPVELFSVASASGALALAETVLDEDRWHDLAEDGDEREVLRALTGPRWVLTESPELHHLIRHAEQLKRRTTEAPA